MPDSRRDVPRPLWLLAAGAGRYRTGACRHNGLTGPTYAGDVTPGDHADDPEAAVPEVSPIPLRPVGNVRRKTFGGAMLAAAMVGLQEALEGPRDEPVVLEIGSGAGGDDDDPMAVDLDPIDPSASVAVVRPWLKNT